MLRVNSVFASSVLLALATTAQGAGIIPIGSSMTFAGTNAPDTYSATTTFSSTPVLVDGGAVEIWQTQTPDGSNAEWDVFYMETVSGGPLANDIDANWNLTVGYDLSVPVVFDQVAFQWSVSGTPVDPLFNFSGICCATSSNPILPGEAYYDTFTPYPISAGFQSDFQLIYADPYNGVSEGGIDPSTANEFAFGLHFTLDSATPEPVSMLLIGGGLAGLALLRRRRNRA